MQILLIVAMTPDGLIGKHGRIPWHEPEDLEFFKQTTMGHAIVMGRKTFDSIGRALPGRRNIVITRNASWRPPVDANVDLAPSLESALQLCNQRGEQKAFIIGGAEIFSLGLSRADELLVTWIKQPGLTGDTYFPEWKRDEWIEVESREAGSLRFVRYRRQLM